MVLTVGGRCSRSVEAEQGLEGQDQTPMDFRSFAPRLAGPRRHLTWYHPAGRREVIIRLMSLYSSVSMYFLACSRYGRASAPGVTLFSGW